MVEIKRHESMRGYFAFYLYKIMENNPDIYFLTGDLGFGMADFIKRDFPDRFINCGASEQAMMGIAVGLAMEGKRPFAYSITPFLIYRAFETIRNYVDREAIPVVLVGGGRGRDYGHDGFSHWAEEDKDVMAIFKNIESYWPETKEELPALLARIISNPRPAYVNLKR